MKKVDIISNIVARKGEALATPSKDISKVNLSGYLLKSIWDKVFEIRTDSQGTEYIFGKLPMVTQYGITMYSGDGVDIPSLASGLPFDGRTIWYNPDTQQIEVIGGTGGGSGEGVSNFWDLSGIPSWITNSKPKYSYSEIEGTPDLSAYAQVDTLKAYVTLAGAQNINGEKNFIGGLKVNGSPIIYDSVNKCWKLQGNLVLTGGITMYADDGTLNLPSIYDGLPIDGTTIYWENGVLKAVGSSGGGVADSVAWGNITGKPTWITNSKPKYSYTEIEGTPDLSKYALKTDIPSLSGYATESWVIGKGYALGSDLDALAIIVGNKADKTELAKYIPISGYTEVSGEKNFTGGLKVNGSPIYYDTEKKYWKLEGDLLVTGGVTMYGSDSSFTPSTIMDAIAVDGTTISKSGGVLKVIGGTGGGVADSVAWANITGKPTFASVATSGKYSDLSGTPSSLPASDVYSWAKAANKPSYTWSEITSKPTWIGTSKPSYSYSEITGAISTTELQNYLTSNSYLNVTSGDNRYLKLSGGTLSSNSRSPLTLKSGSSENHSLLLFNRGSDYWGSIGFNAANSLIFKDTNGANYTIWHSGNDGSGSGLDADLLDNHHEEDFVRGFVNNVANLNTPFTTNRPYIWRYGKENSNIPAGVSYYSNILHVGVNGADTAFDLLGSYYNNRLFFRTGTWSADGSGTIFTNDWKEIAFTDSNVASATKLQTARTIWGQSFDGTSNIHGSMTGLNYILGFAAIRNSSNVNESNGIWVGSSMSSDLVNTDLAYYATKHIFLAGSVGIGTTNPSYTLDVNGSIHSLGSSIYGNVFVNGYGASGNKSGASIVINKGDGYFGIGPSASNVSYMSLGTTSNSSGTWKSEFITIDRLGSVGIGTTTPSLKLHVEGGVQVNGQIIGANSIVSNTTNGYFVGNRNDGLGVTDGGLLLYTYGKTPISFYANGERMRIDASTGNVGIGTASPAYKLQVNGSGSYGGFLFLNNYGASGNKSGASLIINKGGNYFGIGPSNTNVEYMSFGTTSDTTGTWKSEMITINRLGAVGIGTSNPLSRLHVNGVLTLPLNIQVQWTDSGGAMIYGTSGKRIMVDGDILATGGVTMYSMRTLKNVVDERGLSLSELSTIKPTRYTWKDGRDNRLHFGGIADDIQQVLPEVVYKTSDGILTMDYGNAAFAVASSLIQPVVDHEKRIAMLQERIVELEEEVERLKSA